MYPLSAFSIPSEGATVRLRNVGYVIRFAQGANLGLLVDLESTVRTLLSIDSHTYPIKRLPKELQRKFVQFILGPVSVQIVHSLMVGSLSLVESDRKSSSCWSTRLEE